MLRKIDCNIWVAEQPFRFLGLDIGIRMTVISLKNDELAVISPIKIDHKIIEQFKEIGNVKHIIAPNLFHHLFLSDFKNIYPQAQIYAVSGLKKKRPDISIDKILDDDEQYFGSKLEYFLFEGLNTFLLNGLSPLNEYVFFHGESKTLIVTDIVFNFDESFPFTTKLVSKILGVYKQLKPSFLERLGTKEKEKVRQSVQKILQRDFRRVIMAHGTIVEDDAKQKFKKGYECFLEKKF
ncbi:DUF4336 domain-containing protein [Okeania sp. SIO2B3]|uniref:DUF4336 domain-containing protein n=1 Tax=Okeania sp. SIO2B3 TaxID=2607784 RepID=UPI0013C1C4AD|nr:DUF4336 domain-containing protein [Okeania sp. SIO2B3]NET43579.1 DUF4336 domain-containing protein [Okeania sp. SIO2B3]